MKMIICSFAFIASVVFSTQALAQSNASEAKQCNWWGRATYPLCQKKDTGWGKESGKKCIGEKTCRNDQPSDRGGVIGGGSSSGGGSGSSGSSSSGGFGNNGDQCNTTAQCQAVYGNKATDCLDSRSNSSVCMCGSKRCDAKPNPGNPTNPGSGVPQPPSNCSNVSNRIPNNIKIHTILNKHVPRSSFPRFSKWYKESGKTQRFQLHEGDQNTTSRILRPRVEAFAPGWKRGSQNKWHEFSANYYLSDWDKGQRYAVFQIKTNDASNFIIQALIEKNGSLLIARRSKGNKKIANNVLRKPFNLRVRSNGRKFEVWLDCKRVLAENHPQPNLESNKTNYHFRWGLYRQKADDDRQDGTSTLHVTGAKFN